MSFVACLALCGCGHGLGVPLDAAALPDAGDAGVHDAGDAFARDAALDAASDAARDATPDAVVPAACGDGRLDPGELCDDGNRLAGDGCNEDCLSDETCGNAVLDPEEQCDLGSLNSEASGAPCRPDCLLPRCGDGVVDPAQGEICDEGFGNSTAPDALCRPDCRPARCGDGVVDVGAGEVCDDGNRFDGDGCSADCLSDETCGNGRIDLVTGEWCDDGNSQAGDGCFQCRHAETQVNVAWEGAQSLQCIAAAPSGSMVVIFRDGTGSGSQNVMQRFDGNGARDGGPVALPGWLYVVYGCILRDSGELLVLGCDSRLLLRRLTAAGTIASESPLPAATSSGNCPGCALAGRADETAVVVWSALPYDPNGEGLRAQLLDTQGVPEGTRIDVAPSALGRPAVAAAGDGRFLVVWGYDAEGQPVVRSRWYRSDGSADASAFQVNSAPLSLDPAWTATMRQAVAVAPSGAAVVAWSASANGPGSTEVFARQVAADGTLVGPERVVNQFTLAEQSLGGVALAVDGRFAVSWSSEEQDGSNWGVFARLFDAQGASAGSDFGLSSQPYGLQYGPQVTALPGGGFLFAWTSAGQDGDGYGVFALRVGPAGLVMPLGP